MVDRTPVRPLMPSVPTLVPPAASGGGQATVNGVLDQGVRPGETDLVRAHMRDLRQLKTALASDDAAVRDAFVASLENGTIDGTIRQLSTAELRRLTQALPADGKGPDSRAAFASMISRMPGLPFDRETLLTLRAMLVDTGYQGDLDRFDLSYPTR